jgi:hypothetical protein
MHQAECGICRDVSHVPQVRVGALATGGFLERSMVSVQQNLKGYTMTYFLAIIVALIIVFVLLERDAF